MVSFVKYQKDGTLLQIRLKTKVKQLLGIALIGILYLLFFFTNMVKIGAYRQINPSFCILRTLRFRSNYLFDHLKGIINQHPYLIQHLFSI